MGLDSFKSETTRKVWENKNNAKVMSVSGILTEGEYNIEVEHKDDEIVMRCTSE